MRRALRSGAGKPHAIGRTVEPTAQDPLDPNGVQEGGVEIKNGTLQVTLGYFGGDMVTRPSRSIPGRPLCPHRYDSINVERSQGIVRSVSVNYATRRMERSIGKISDDTTKSRGQKLPAKPLLTMRQVGDGLDSGRRRNSRRSLPSVGLHLRARFSRKSFSRALASPSACAIDAISASTA